jgi:hypothetical protein
MVLSQLYLPRHVGMASGLSVGLAIGVGGVAAVVSSAIAAAVDLAATRVSSAESGGQRLPRLGEPVDGKVEIVTRVRG